jgi:hypothetical protein
MSYKPSKKDRELMITINVFLLGREEVKNLFWNIYTVDYNPKESIVKIGINTINGKLGTTLEKLRKTSKDLSQYLRDSGLTYKKSNIIFFVDKSAAETRKLEELIESVEAKL